MSFQPGTRILCWTSLLRLPIIPWGIMLTRSYRGQESLVRYWTMQAVELCYAIDDVASTSLTEYVPPVLDAIRAMEEERRLMVIGAAGCGKSSLLAGLSGCPLMAQVPLEAPFVRWRFRNDGGSAECSRFLPAEQLDGLELVDTASCAEPAVAEALRALMPGVDVVVAVLDGRHPEDSPVWELLASPEGAAVEAVVLAVTFAHGPEVSEKVRELCRERLGRNLPVYGITPTSASAMETFCQRVQEALDSPSGLRAAIRNVVDAGVDLMYKQGSALKKLEATDRTNSSFLRQIEDEIDNFLTHQRADLPRRMDSYSEAVRRARPRLLRRLRWVFGWVFSPVTILRLELLGTGCELFYYRHMREEVLRFQQDSDRQFVLSCSAHWKSARPRMQRELSCDIGDFPEDKLTSELTRLRELLGRELYTPFAREQLRHRFSRLFAARSGWMRASLAFICLFLIFAGLLGLLGQDMPAAALGGVALLIWFFASLAHLVASRRIRRSIDELGQLLDTSACMTLRESVERLITSRMAAYRRLYALPRRKVDELERLLKPLQEHHMNIIRQLRASAAARM